MTDNEIIKAIWHCLTDLDCLDCPYVDYEGKERCDEKVLNDLCDLINRQKAEIERLKDYPKCVYEYDGDITDYCLKTPCPNYKTVDAIKAEAVKEFDELLKEDCLAYPLEKDDLTMLVDVKSYNNLVKEMVGADGD